jgi:hypothetical protein
LASVTAICNLALIKYGDRTITSINEASKEGRACKVLYPLMRDEMLYAHPWNFAMRRADITGSLTDTPVFGYDYAYQLPPKCLRVWELFDALTDSTASRVWLSQGQMDKTNVSPEVEWDVEGTQLLTDQEENIYIRYLIQVTESGKFNPAFVNCLATRLAAELAVKLAKSKTMRADLLSELDKKWFPEARRLNAIEGVKRKHRDQQPLDEGYYSWQAR